MFFVPLYIARYKQRDLKFSDLLKDVWNHQRALPYQPKWHQKCTHNLFQKQTYLLDGKALDVNFRQSQQDAPRFVEIDSPHQIQIRNHKILDQEVKENGVVSSFFIFSMLLANKKNELAIVIFNSTATNSICWSEEQQQFNSPQQLCAYLYKNEFSEDPNKLRVNPILIRLLNHEVENSSIQEYFGKKKHEGPHLYDEIHVANPQLYAEMV